MQILSSKRVGLINQGESYDVKELTAIGYKFHWIITNKVGSIHSTELFHPIVNRLPTEPDSGTVTILSNGTNIREAATTSSQIVLVQMQEKSFQSSNEMENGMKFLYRQENLHLLQNGSFQPTTNILTTEPVMKETQPCSRYT